MGNIFTSGVGGSLKKSAFNLSHSRKFSFAPGGCYPILCEETLPGDKWSYDVNALVRFQPMISPVMHLIDVYSYGFKVPARLCMEYSKFEVFITGGEKGDGKDAQGNTVQIPYVNVHDGASGSGAINVNWFAAGTLSDYLGINIAASGTDTIRLQVMPFLAFWRIWCEYFRDQNLFPDYVSLYPNVFQNQGDITPYIYAAMNDATNPMAFFDIPPVCWEKDYFTSALPFAQRGDAVETPLTGTATVTYKPVSAYMDSAGGSLSGSAASLPASVTPAPNVLTGGGEPSRVENIEDVELVSGGFTINALRVAARLQEWLEKMARGGARYIEQMFSQWRVTSSDARLQRPEFLGGGKIPVSISEVLQTGENGTTPLAEMAGHGLAAGKVNGWSTYCEEHCYVISLFFLRPRTSYQQGLRRMFTHRFDKLDWAWPSFAHLGEQEVAQSEIYATLDNSDNAGTFGYQMRYAEYKYIPSTVHGEFKTTLKVWHWGRIFVAPPTLSKEFVSCDPSPRIFNVIQDGDPLYAIVSNRINCVRSLPYRGEPYL